MSKKTKSFKPIRWLAVFFRRFHWYFTDKNHLWNWKNESLRKTGPQIEIHLKWIVWFQFIYFLPKLSQMSSEEKRGTVKWLWRQQSRSGSALSLMLFHHISLFTSFHADFSWLLVLLLLSVYFLLLFFIQINWCELLSHVHMRSLWLGSCWQENINEFYKLTTEAKTCLHVCQLELFNYKCVLITGVFHMRYWSSVEASTHRNSTEHLQFTKCDYICVVSLFASGSV